MLDKIRAGNTASGTASSKKITMLRSDVQKMTSRAPSTQCDPNQSRCIRT